MRFLSAQVKIRQIPHVNFEMTSQFFFTFCIILHCHDTLISLIPSNFEIFQVLWCKFAIFLMSFSKPQVSYLSNFTSLFLVTKDNSSGLFQVKRYILCTIWTNQSGNFENFECSGQNSPSSCHFLNKSVFRRVLHQLSWDLILYTFLAEILYTFNKKNLSKYKLAEISRKQSKV